MRRLAVATVLSARPWEEDFVAFVRDGAALRIVARAYDPEEVIRRVPDVVVVGSETSWMSPTHVRAWRRRGIKVLGLHPAGDDPGRELFHLGGADAVLPETTSMVGLFRAVRALSVIEHSVGSEGTLVAVTGPRGAPGRTEMALALALGASGRHRTLLVDLDPPSIGIRLGLGPHPTLLDALDEVRTGEKMPPVRRVGSLSILTGIQGGPLAAPLRWELIRASLDSYDLVIADLGPWPQSDAILRTSKAAILVCDASPTGMVRARTLIQDWVGPTPRVLLNRGDDDEHTRRLAREALGLEPTVTIPYLESVRAASLEAALPPALLIDQTAAIGLSALSGSGDD